MEAAKDTYSILTENLMSTVGVWWFPKLVLQVWALVIGGGWAVANWFVQTGWAKAEGLTENELTAVKVTAVLQGLLTLAIISFFARVVYNVVEALYICYALDKDGQTVVSQEVHDVYAMLPSTNQVVENPGGDIMYAAPDSQLEEGRARRR